MVTMEIQEEKRETPVVCPACGKTNTILVTTVTLCATGKRLFLRGKGAVYLQADGGFDFYDYVSKSVREYSTEDEALQCKICKTNFNLAAFREKVW